MLELFSEPTMWFLLLFYVVRDDLFRTSELPLIDQLMEAYFLLSGDILYLLFCVVS